MSAASPTVAPPARQVRPSGPSGGIGDAWKVVVLNDNHNTFEGVAEALSQVLPSVSYQKGLAFADRIHNDGLCVVWSGHQEAAELYHEQLHMSGLTMAPLER
jgi:ATP-dependent Clp protease adaptor protein ClpS